MRAEVMINANKALQAIPKAATSRLSLEEARATMEEAGQCDVLP